MGFSGGSEGKGRPRFDLWVGKIPWRRKWQLSPVFLPGESHGQRSLAGYSPRGRKESDKTERLHSHFIVPLGQFLAGTLSPLLRTLLRLHPAKPLTQMPRPLRTCPDAPVRSSPARASLHGWGLYLPLLEAGRQPRFCDGLV